MKPCPNCGYENSDTRHVCLHCRQPLPSSGDVADAAADATALRRTERKEPDAGLRFFAGLGLGLLPLAGGLIAASAGLYQLWVVLYGIAFVAMLVCLFRQNLRYI